MAIIISTIGCGHNDPGTQASPSITKVQEPGIRQKAQAEHGHPRGPPGGETKGVVDVPEAGKKTSAGCWIQMDSADFRFPGESELAS